MAGNRTKRLASWHGFPMGTNNQFKRLYSKKTKTGSERRKALATAVKNNRAKWGAFGHSNVTTKLKVRKAIKKFGNLKAMKLGRYIAQRQKRTK